jgi:hypothetical protein
MTYHLQAKMDMAGWRVHVSKDLILVTGRISHSGEVNYSVSQGGNPKNRNFETILDMLKVADGEITKHLEQYGGA